MQPSSARSRFTFDIGNDMFDLENDKTKYELDNVKRSSTSSHSARRASDVPLMQDDLGIFRFTTLAGWQVGLTEEVEELEKDMRALAAAVESVKDGMARVVAKSKVRVDSMIGDGRVRCYEADIDIVDTREL